MLDKAVQMLTEADLAQALTDQLREGKHLDYKETLPGTDSKEKKHFLADVSAMANAAGGLILYGIKEKRDGGQTTGLPDAIPGLVGVIADQEIRRLDNMLLQGVKPRIQGVVFHPIPLQDGNLVLAVRVPRSWNGPHVVDNDGHWRFYTRAAAGNMPMDVDEVRVAFTMGDTITQRLQQFRLERLGKIVALETPAQLTAGAKLVLHLLPLTLGDPRSRLALVELAQRDDLFGLLLPLSGGADRRINVDGYLMHNQDGYVQLFRSGAIEVVDSDLLKDRRQEDSRPYIPSTLFEQRLLQKVGRYLSALRDVGVSAPIYVSLALMGVKGYQMAAPTRWVFQQTLIDRDDLILPEVLVEDLSTDPATILKPLLDMVWNACGFERSMNFDEHGKWTGRV